MSQHYKNHSRLVLGYHGITLPLLLALIGGSIANLVTTSRDNLYSASLIVLIAVILSLIYIYARAFALRAQDRAIRAEESLRHFLITGKPIDARLRLGQIIALRFASEEELVALTKKAIDEKLSNRDIKKNIRNWRADYHRV
ncbi:MAG TPA: DUF6526 family protein [Flavitalea sp.]|nr:DUF6526 family protein [Flavitalea sp.]